MKCICSKRNLHLTPQYSKYEVLFYDGNNRPAQMFPLRAVNRDGEVSTAPRYVGVKCLTLDWLAPEFALWCPRRRGDGIVFKRFSVQLCVVTSGIHTGAFHTELPPHSDCSPLRLPLRPDREGVCGYSALHQAHSNSWWMVVMWSYHDRTGKWWGWWSVTRWQVKFLQVIWSKVFHTKIEKLHVFTQQAKMYKKPWLLSFIWFLILMNHNESSTLREIFPKPSIFLVFLVLAQMQATKGSVTLASSWDPGKYRFYKNARCQHQEIDVKQRVLKMLMQHHTFTENGPKSAISEWLRPGTYTFPHHTSCTVHI